MSIPVLALPPETVDGFRRFLDAAAAWAEDVYRAFGLPTYLLGPPMSERDAFLASIKAQWHEDTPRLAFADWLDENGAGDLDRATAEFLRVARDNRTGGRGKGGGASMPRAAYPWLAGNWHRLIPRAVALHVGTRVDGVFTVGARPAVHRDGRVVHAQWALPTDSVQFRGETVIARYCVRLRFNRGFLESAHLYDPATQGTLTLPLAADQPFVVFPQNRPAEAAA